MQYASSANRMVRSPESLPASKAAMGMLELADLRL